MWPDADGSWSVGDSYAEPYTDSTVAADLSQYTQAVDNSGTGSSWGGFLQGALGQVLNYGMQRDAAKSQAALQAQQTAALAQGAALARPAAPMGLLLVGGIVLAIVLAAGRKG